MIQELLYTSAPKGLKPGSRGFCTVLSTSGMPAPVATALEALSGYRPVYPPGDPLAAQNPVVFSYLKMSLSGRRSDVFSRIADYGLDYSQRTNKLAHHLVIDASDRPQAGPAWLLAHSGMMRDEWNGELQVVSGERSIPPANSPLKICSAWANLTGDAGWAGVLAEAFLKHPEQPAYIIFAPGMNLLPLIEEAIALLPVNQRWDVTFSTYFTKIPNGVTCNWRCLLADSPEAKESRRYVQSLRIDLTANLPKATGGPLVEAAKTGVMPAESSGPPSIAPQHKTPSIEPPADETGRRVRPAHLAPPRLRSSVTAPPVRNAPRRTGRWLKWMFSVTVVAAISTGVSYYILHSNWKPSQQSSVATTDHDVTKQSKNEPQAVPKADAPVDEPKSQGQKEAGGNEAARMPAQPGNDSNTNKQETEKQMSADENKNGAHADQPPSTTSPNPTPPIQDPEKANAPELPELIYVDLPEDGSQSIRVPVDIDDASKYSLVFCIPNCDLGEIKPTGNAVYTIGAESNGSVKIFEAAMVKNESAMDKSHVNISVLNSTPLSKLSRQVLMIRNLVSGNECFVRFGGAPSLADGKVNYRIAGLVVDSQFPESPGATASSLDAAPHGTPGNQWRLTLKKLLVSDNEKDVQINIVDSGLELEWDKNSRASAAIQLSDEFKSSLLSNFVSNVQPDHELLEKVKNAFELKVEVRSGTLTRSFKSTEVWLTADTSRLDDALSKNMLDRLKTLNGMASDVGLNYTVPNLKSIRQLNRSKVGEGIDRYIQSVGSRISLIKNNGSQAPAPEQNLQINDTVNKLTNTETYAKTTNRVFIESQNLIDRVNEIKLVAMRIDQQAYQGDESVLVPFLVYKIDRK